MGAKNSVTYGTEDLLRIVQKGNKALALVGEKERMKLLPDLDKALEAFKNGNRFEVSLPKPTSFREFHNLDNPTQAIFNQLASEVPGWEFINQIEEVCSLQRSTIEQYQPFIKELWEDRVAENPFSPPDEWEYLSVPEAIEAFQSGFDHSMKAGSVVKQADQFEPWEHSEGIQVCPSLSFLSHYFEIPEELGISEDVKPWDNTEEARAAYAKIVDLFVPLVGEAFTQTYRDRGYTFRNWREGKLTARHIWLTPAGTRAWQELEERSDGDFVVFPANTGSLYAGHSVHRTRICIVITLDPFQFGQDTVMGGSILMVQPSRLTAFENLGIDCPGNQYSPDADGRFAKSVCFCCFGGLHFGARWAGAAARYFGSAVGSLGQ